MDLYQIKAHVDMKGQQTNREGLIHRALSFFNRKKKILPIIDKIAQEKKENRYSLFEQRDDGHQHCGYSCSVSCADDCERDCEWTVIQY